jgi:lipopolysaccharide assembly protein A
MRYIRYFLLGLIGVALVTVSLANRQPVTLKLLPEDLAALFQISTSVTLPLFLVILAGVLAGLLIGFFWEYLREFKYRRTLSKQGRAVTKLKREVSELRNRTGDGKDDILALIE